MLTLFYYDRYYDFCPFETVFRSQKYRNLLCNDECQVQITLYFEFVFLVCLVNQGHKTGNFNLLQFYGSWQLCYTGIGYPQVNGCAASLFCLYS